MDSIINKADNISEYGPNSEVHEGQLMSIRSPMHSSRTEAWNLQIDSIGCCKISNLTIISSACLIYLRMGTLCCPGPEPQKYSSELMEPLSESIFMIENKL